MVDRERKNIRQVITDEDFAYIAIKLNVVF